MKEDIKKYVGRKGTIILSGLTIEVRIEDVKQSYGKIRFLVKPVAGTGNTWMEKVTVNK